MFQGLKLSKGNASANSHNGNSNAFQTQSNNKSRSSIFSWKTIINHNVTVASHHERLPTYPPEHSTIPLPPIVTSLPDSAPSSRMGAFNDYKPSPAKETPPARPGIGSRDKQNSGYVNTRDLPITPESIYSREALTTGSILKDDGFPRLKRKRMKIYLPPSTQAEIIAYMTSSIITNPKLIPLWSPPPTLQRGTVQRGKRVAVGDVGYFDSDGGFRVMFNVFWDQNSNKECGFLTPPYFNQFVSPQSLLFRSRSQSMAINGSKTGHSTPSDGAPSNRRVDSDDSAIIVRRKFKDPNGYFHSKMAVDVKYAKDEVIYSLSPHKSKLAMFLCFPQGAVTYELDESVNTALGYYLAANAEQWCQHFDRFGIFSRMVFVRGVVLAKSFASAVFRGTPQSSSSAQLRKTIKDDTLRWSEASNGFEKTIVSGQQDDFEQQGRSSSLADDQCAALEGLEVTATASAATGVSRQSFQTLRFK
ncbi:hypothetical protein CPB83DRAFT_903278 [Crepidotus variabilis]|uniref:Uncharacterized protein n=1 Tax=Crepidotus variabilis TaxID=179855 RepID=A0A9P6EN12_9AGAR|nr:hypothetical protein CPB83DRAFT_903278 [Crepidotus variabilis]